MAKKKPFGYNPSYGTIGNVSGSDQWELDGNCKICRKNDYCKTQCGPNRVRSQQLLDNIINKVMPPLPRGPY